MKNRELNYYLCYTTFEGVSYYYTSDGEDFTPDFSIAAIFMSKDCASSKIDSYKHNVFIGGTWYIRMTYRDIDVMLDEHGQYCCDNYDKEDL